MLATVVGPFLQYDHSMRWVHQIETASDGSFRVRPRELRSLREEIEAGDDSIHRLTQALAHMHRITMCISFYSEQSQNFKF